MLFNALFSLFFSVATDAGVKPSIIPGIATNCANCVIAHELRFPDFNYLLKLNETLKKLVKYEADGELEALLVFVYTGLDLAPTTTGDDEFIGEAVLSFGYEYGVVERDCPYNPYAHILKN